MVMYSNMYVTMAAGTFALQLEIFDEQFNLHK